MSDYYNKLSTYVESISDDFGSTFSVVDDNTLANMLGLEGDFNKVVEVVSNYIPDCKLEFIKTNQLNSEYDIYLVKIVY
jgi:hypothetical protein